MDLDSAGVMGSKAQMFVSDPFLNGNITEGNKDN